MPETSTILLVDDEESIQKLLTYPLERDGYRVVQARDGEEALRRFGEEEIDLVVLDIMLPKLDGLEVCKRLRAESTVPIIMLTARDDELDKVLGLELGADDYITKPFLDPRVPEPRPGRAAPRRDAAPRRQARGDDRSRRRPDRPAAADGRGAGRARAADIRRVRAARAARRDTRASCTRAGSCSSGSVEAPTTASRARSTSTSGICARRSSANPASRS